MKIQVDQSTIQRIVKELSHGAEDKVRLGYLLGKVGNGDIIVEGVYVPIQESRRAYTTVRDLQSLTKAKEAASKEGQTILGIVKYHAGLPVFESAVDKKSLQNLSVDPKIGLVVNEKGEYKIFE